MLSPVAAEGIGLRHKLDCMLAKSPDEWAESVLALAHDDGLWERLSQNARDYVADSYSPESGRRMMRAAFEAADLFSGPGRS